MSRRVREPDGPDLVIGHIKEVTKHSGWVVTSSGVDAEGQIVITLAIPKPAPTPSTATENE